MENILTNSIKCYQKWEIKNICLIILIISLYAERTIKGFECVPVGYVKNLAIRRMFYFEILLQDMVLLHVASNYY